MQLLTEGKLREERESLERIPECTNCITTWDEKGEGSRRWTQIKICSWSWHVIPHNEKDHSQVTFPIDLSSKRIRREYENPAPRIRSACHSTTTYPENKSAIIFNFNFDRKKGLLKSKSTFFNLLWMLNEWWKFICTTRMFTRIFLSCNLLRIWNRDKIKFILVLQWHIYLSSFKKNVSNNT